MGEPSNSSTGYLNPASTNNFSSPIAVPSVSAV